MTFKVQTLRKHSKTINQQFGVKKLEYANGQYTLILITQLNYNNTKIIIKTFLE